MFRGKIWLVNLGPTVDLDEDLVSIEKALAIVHRLR
jgi:hypothetical protein